MKEGIFRITGQIVEKESRAGLPGLRVRAYDKDLIYDDLLSTAITDEKGRFTLEFTETDFRELFEGRPDTYLRVYGAENRLLLTTEKTVRWNASQKELFFLEISREVLGEETTKRPADRVEGGVRFSLEDVRLLKQDIFDIVKIPGFIATGAPGAPALPTLSQTVVLPLGGDVLELVFHPGEPVRLGEQVNPLPIQKPILDIGIGPSRSGSEFSSAQYSTPFTPLDPAYLKAGEPYPQTLVELERVETFGPVQLATVLIHPVQFDTEKRTYLVFPNLHYDLRYDYEKASALAERRARQQEVVGTHFTEILERLKLDGTTIFAAQIFLPERVVLEDMGCLILTDNFSWPESMDRGDGTTRAPTLAERGPALWVDHDPKQSGDLVAEFERLAEWKTSRGMRTKVITISSIVERDFGDFTDGNFARDLAEVVRNFVKRAHDNWNIQYLLIGGDINVVPMRMLSGCGVQSGFGCSRTDTNPPETGSCHTVANASVVKIHPAFTPSPQDPLSTMIGGLRIPYNREAGSGQLGWYYTSEGNFNGLSQGFTRLEPGVYSNFIIVEGPLAVIDDSYYWVLEEVNSIPSDFYYCSLVGDGYSNQGKHDFDANNNGIYGQVSWDQAGHEVSLDGVKLLSDIWVGRAQVDNEIKARSFVDKVLTYERLIAPDGEHVDLSYLQKVLFASSYWGRTGQSKVVDPPNLQAGQFCFRPDLSQANIITNFDLTMQPTMGGIALSHHLVARTGQITHMLPYSPGANSTNQGWYFCASADFSMQSTSPTRFIKVLGPEAVTNPEEFFWDPIGLEGAAQEKEAMRLEMSRLYPDFDRVERYYQDYFDLSTPPGIFPLETIKVRDALDTGFHFVSLTGHGRTTGCCEVESPPNSTPPRDFQNNRRYSIMYANSCHTACPDLIYEFQPVDSLAEYSTTYQAGGAVAFVGNTRDGWINDGARYEDFFWKKLNLSGNLGMGAGWWMMGRLAGPLSTWAIYDQNLFGDPSMDIWSEPPVLLEVTHPSTAEWGSTFIVTVRRELAPAENQRVTIMSAWSGSAQLPEILETAATDSNGQTKFTLPNQGPAGDIRVTVTGRNAIPYMGAISISWT